MKKDLFIKKGIDICNAKSMFEYLHNHYRYCTMNSWNNLYSVAHNVKMYNLCLDGNEWNALALLEADQYSEINYMLECWEEDHPGYSVGFNGRSGGYLVLCNEKNNRNVLPDEIIEYDYEEFKQYCKDYYGSVKNYMSELRFYTELVRDFDRLCEDLRERVNELSLLDPIKTIVNERIEIFVGEYCDELEDDIIFTESHEIPFTDDLRHHKSLVDCLFDILRCDAYKVRIEDDKFVIKEY